VSGPGSLNKCELQRAATRAINALGANDEATLLRAVSVNLGTTFRDQADWWIENVQARKRKPIKASTAASWKSALKWINEQIGDTPLSSVNNRVMRDSIVAPGSKKYSPKMLHNVVQVVKMVVASAKNDEGEARFPVVWDHDFIDLPVIDNQHRPTFTAGEVTKIVSKAEARDAVLFALLAGSGLRIREALALQVGDVRDGVIVVKQALSAVTNKLQSPKTKNGVREVDLHTSISVMLKSVIGKRRSGFVFHNGSGDPLNQRIALDQLHDVLSKIGVEPCGFHAFRRFRNTHLRKAHVPDRLTQYWMGHAPVSMTDNYDRVREDLEFRRFTAEQVGIGFIPPVARQPVSAVSPRVTPSSESVTI